MKFDKSRPYQNLPPLPPKVDMETKKVLKKAISAHSALSRLDAASAMIPNPSVLINTIPLLEAQASSEIENIVTTQDELFKAANNIAFTSSTATKEALRYRTALHEGFRAIQKRPLTINTAVTICSNILGFETNIRSGTGTFIGNPHSKERIYTPPEGKDIILGHLKEWEKFLYTDDDLDPLIKLALLHYQFEAIHPFNDGNGRTGRILNVLYLVEKHILRLPITYLSGYIVRHKNDYYSLLNGVTTHNNWEDWIIYILHAIETTSEWTLDIINHIAILQDQTTKEINSFNQKLPATDLSELLFTQPYIRSNNIEQSCKVTRQTASSWLKQLEKARVVSHTKIGKNNVFINTRFLDLLFNTKPTD